MLVKWRRKPYLVSKKKFGSYGCHFQVEQPWKPKKLSHVPVQYPEEVQSLKPCFFTEVQL